MTNACIYDCKYCLNRCSNDVRRAAFSPRELADLTIGFYKRNYIEGLFLSSGIMKSPNETCEKLLEVLMILRNEYNFNGYIHVKGIPGADSEILSIIGRYADRMSVNIELPSEQSLKELAPDKSKMSILKPMGFIRDKIKENSYEMIKYKSADKFVPAGQGTQMIIGATPDTDMQILTLSEALYEKYSLKRVFYSAYIPVTNHPMLPDMDTKPPLLREHRLYQADWLLRFYGFSASELLDAEHPNFNPYLDPKCNWAVNHMGEFPVEINKAPIELLLRVPGIGTTSAKKIVVARKVTRLGFSDLKKIGVVLKRAQYFILCEGKVMDGMKTSENSVILALISQRGLDILSNRESHQLSFFEISPTREDVVKCLSGQM